MDMHSKQQQQTVNVDLDKATTLKCENKLPVPEKGIQVECESTLFAPGFELKKISALVSPNGQTSVAPVQIFYCINCGSRYNLEDLK